MTSWRPFAPRGPPRVGLAFPGDATMDCGTMPGMSVTQFRPEGRHPEPWLTGDSVGGVPGWVAQVAPARPPEANPFEFLYAPGSKWLVLWMGLSPFVLALLIIWTRRRWRRK